MELQGVYEPHNVENKWYSYWLEKDYFKVNVEKEKKSFCIVIPPPNVTGSLHMGHALDNTIQDIIIRFRRMEGYNALWIPGTDHAGIATQNVVEKQLRKEGLTRKDLGREEFLKRVWAWKDEYGRNIVYQLQRLGVSCDWSRERFTMDKVCSRAVRTAFKKLFDKGLIYRGKYIINWCPRCLTAISDLEVKYTEMEGKLYQVRYPFEDGNGEIIVSTTRPETMLGDTAVAVHPDDERYKGSIGRKLLLPILNRPIPLIADSYADPSFGTGAVKITPAHDPNDFQVGNRHKLPRVVVIGENGLMTEEAGPYKGLTKEECRVKIVEDLEKMNFLVKVEPYIHNVACCDRCHTVIEPNISEQWFCKMEELAKPAIDAVNNDTTRFFPDKYKDIYINWMENIKDWCISRQLWWGHRIPVWYCDDCSHIFSSIEEPQSCPKCSSHRIHQDNDVLDTWFSSGLWPLSTLGWPENSDDLNHFYPTSVLVTARDIIFLWVARMMMMGLEFKGNVPFNHVFIHSTILNKEGKRMSKSLGTGIDPLELIDKYGTDATRFGLTFMTAQGQDVKFTEEKLEMSRNFANKLWNASRFILMNLKDFTPENKSLCDMKLGIAEKWILSRYNQLIKTITPAYENYEFSIATREIYEFLWNEFCDWYLEISKFSLYNKEETEGKNVTCYVLWYVITNTLKLLHPVMPFITEEIYSHFVPSGEKSIMFEAWPQGDEGFIDKNAEKEMETLTGIIKAIRAIRGEISLPPSKEVEIFIEATDEKNLSFIQLHRNYIERFSKANPLHTGLRGKEKRKSAFYESFQEIDVYMPFGDLVDVQQEIKKLNKEYDGLDKDLSRINGKLSNEAFLSKAPKEIIDKEISRKNELLFKIERIKARLEIFNDK